MRPREPVDCSVTHDRTAQSKIKQHVTGCRGHTRTQQGGGLEAIKPRCPPPGSAPKAVGEGACKRNPASPQTPTLQPGVSPESSPKYGSINNRRPPTSHPPLLPAAGSRSRPDHTTVRRRRRSPGRPPLPRTSLPGARGPCGGPAGSPPAPHRDRRGV